jgi:hypothetical protein
MSQGESIYDLLREWARRTASGFAELVGTPPEPERDTEAANELIYRLKQWPHLANAQKTAAVYRTLSVMSNRPVNRRWILAQSKLAPQEADSLLQHWIAAGCIEVIDPSLFSRPSVPDSIPDSEPASARP